MDNIKSLFLLIVIVSCNMEKKEGYRVITPEEMIHLSKEKKGSFYNQIPYNLAIIQKLNDGSYIMMPQTTSNGLLFFDKESLDQMVKDQAYPAETDTDSFYDILRTEIDCIDENIAFFETVFFDTTQMSFDYDLSDDFVSRLTEFLDASSFSERLNILDVIVILTNESFRRQVDGEWTFETEYTLNTFKIPLVMDSSDMTVHINKQLSDTIMMEGNVDLKETLIDLVDAYIIRKMPPNEFKYNRRDLYTNLRQDFSSNYKKYLELASTSNTDVRI